MSEEVEVKIELSETEMKRLRERLLREGFEALDRPIHEENLLFDFTDSPLEKQGCALRLRNYGGRSILTFKGPRRADLHLKIRDELETEIDDFETARDILERLGLSVSFTYEKNRQKFRSKQLKGVELCLDETPVGCFVEIEGSHAEILEVAATFGWSEERFLTSNYVDLYRERRK